MFTLNKYDFKVLRYLRSTGGASIEEMEQHFKKKVDAVALRIKILSGDSSGYHTPSRQQPYQIQQEYVQSVGGGRIQITDLGLKVLQDYEAYAVEKKRLLNRDTFYRVITISIATVGMLTSIALLWIEVH